MFDDDANFIDKVFAVVDHHEQTTLADPIDNPVEQRVFATNQDRQLRCHCADDGPGVGDRGEIDEEHTLVEVGEVPVAELDRSPCLAHPAGTRQRDDATDLKLSSNLVQQVPAAEERRRAVWQVRAIPDESAQRREFVLQIGMVHLVQNHGADIAKAVRTQRMNLDAVGQNPHHLVYGSAEHDLTTVCRRSDAGRVMDRHAHEVVVVLQYLADVHPHADPEAQTIGPLMRFEGALRLHRGGKTGAGRIEREKERIPLGAVLDPPACSTAARTIRR